VVLLGIRQRASISDLRADGYGCSIDVKMLTQALRTRECHGMVGKRML
jgi:hypothetical protein